jgi:hypothetical protein
VTSVILQTGNKDTGTFSPQDNPLVIELPGVQSPGQAGSSSFTWNGQSNGGQAVTPGTYYIKVSYTDPYNHVTTVIQNVTVLGSGKHLRISIYNSAGELVKRMQADSVPSSLESLMIDNPVTIGKNSQPIPIQYASGQIMYWNGMNSDNRLVESGIYEIVVELDSGSGYQISSSKSITVFNNGDKNFIQGVKMYPNPVNTAPDTDKQVTLAWNPGISGTMTIQIYNESSELINRLDASLSAGTAQWWLDTFGGSKCATGIYLVVFHAQKDTGEVETTSLKFSIIRK